MAVVLGDRETVEGYYQAMRLGGAGATALARLFTDDEVYIEPFTKGGDGHPRTHIGWNFIAKFFRESVNHRRPSWW